VVDAAAARAWIEAFAAAFEAHREELNDLDRRSGDGDFGTNLNSALERVRTALAGGELATPADVFAAVSGAFMATGGTSGPLFGMWFRELSRATSAEGALGVEALAAAAGAGVAAVQRLGGAQVGDKTMVDAMVPAAEALAAAAGQGLAAALAAAAQAARAGADSTADLVARRGRASYVGEAARGVHDPGAVTVALFFEAAVR
jgi:phosphoenolpyruvate---glycerone phosphotransferase subunit DhaL